MIGTIGVCSWSLRPRDARELAASVRACGLAAVQLALDPIREGREGTAGKGRTGGRWDLDATRRALDEAQVRVLSGMMGTRGEDYATPATIRATGGFAPDAHWRANLAAARANAVIARELGLDLVTLHAGFVPEDARDPLRATLVARLAEVADAFAEHGVRLGLETGQESAGVLLEVLAEVGRANVGVNFDPANLVLYGTGEPIAALRALRGHVLQAHVKDARAPALRGRWGTEVPVGEGEVDWDAFLAEVEAAPRAIDLVVEREAGDRRVEDVRRAVARIADRGGSR